MTLIAALEAHFTALPLPQQALLTVALLLALALVLAGLPAWPRRAPDRRRTPAGSPRPREGLRTGAARA